MIAKDELARGKRKVEDIKRDKLDADRKDKSLEDQVGELQRRLDTIKIEHATAHNKDEVLKRDLETAQREIPVLENREHVEEEERIRQEQQRKNAQR